MKLRMSIFREKKYSSVTLQGHIIKCPTYQHETFTNVFSVQFEHIDELLLYHEVFETQRSSEGKIILTGKIA